MTTTNIIPAIDCPLSGAYLIEASAGTGKTWTLTGILLRLLIEKNTPPERIVATTFTRAAAAEMKERLYGNLDEFYQVCLWAKHHEIELYGLSSDDKNQMINKNSEQVKELSDPIYQYLLFNLLNQSPKELDIMLSRIQLLLASVDKLFIGTLDSLAQKWLKEFGQTQSLDIKPDPNQEITMIVHDALRKLHNQTYYETPLVYSLIDNKIFGDKSSMVKKINNALNFFTAEIDEIKMIDNTKLSDIYDEFRQVIDNINPQDFSYFFVDEEQLYEWGFYKNKIAEQIKYMQETIQTLKNHQEKGLLVFLDLNKNQKKFLEKITEKNIKNPFKQKYNQSVAEKWHSLNHSLNGLIQLHEIYHTIQSIAQKFDDYIVYTIAKTVREKLGQTLEQDNKTSFTLQMVKLLNLLSDKKGEKIAQHIRHLYPVALIDETQDINGEQAQLIYEIYLKDSAKKSLFENSNKGFLLCVGDPKQAIYRFRGGDVANYNYLKTLGLDNRFKLTTNRRSNKFVVEAVNDWFDGKNKGSHINQLGEDICYEVVIAHKQSAAIDWLDDKNNNKAIQFLHLKHGSDYNEFDSVALHINTLLQSDKKIFDKKSADDTDESIYRSIVPSDIAILMNSHSSIKKMQSSLNRLNIDAIIQSEQQVFDTPAANDLSQLIEAVLDAKEQKLVAVLTGIYGYSLKQSQEILTDDKKRSQLLIYLKNILQKWQKYGINTALNFALNEPALLDNNFWAYLAEIENSERYLTDLWQIIDIVSTWQVSPMLFLQMFHRAKKDTSHQRLPLPSESGINLMTIHRSKGLEFNIVYVFDLQKTKSSSSKLYPYTENHRRRLSVCANKDNDDKYYKNIDEKEDLDEKKRLGYVSLTRAAEQLYVVVYDMAKKSENAMNDWGFFVDGKTFAMPERIQNHANLISLDAMMDNQSYSKKPYNAIKDNTSKKQHKHWQDIYKQEVFFGVSNTSFTNIAMNFESRIVAEDTIVIDDDMGITNHKDSGCIQNRFMRGTKAGTYLHKVLQKIGDGQTINTAVVNSTRELGLPLDEVTQNELGLWLHQVASTPFLASNTSLFDIQHKYAEFGFLMGLKDDFNPNEIAGLFERYSNKYLPNIVFEKKNIIKFLKGEIDLLYSYQGKYYIVDYKSNYLSDDIELYNNTLLEKAMNEHGYWLQAAIYQVALHRLLKLRIKNYIGNESSYLGAVEYVFLRGIDESNQYGRLVWDIPLSLVLKLDELFG